MKMKTWILLSVCAMVLPMLFACGGRPSDTSSTQPSASAPPSADKTDPTIEPKPELRWPELIENNRAKYHIIRPDQGNLTTTMAMIVMSEQLKQVSGKVFSTGTDLVGYQGIPDRYEILIGNTNREESAAVLAELSAEMPYAVRQIGKRI